MFPDGLTNVRNATHGFDLPTLLGHAGEAVAFVDSQWIVRYCNDVYLANAGKRADEVLEHTPFDYIPGFERSIFYETIEVCRRENKPMCRIGYSTALGRWLMVRVFPVDGGVLLLANDASQSVVDQYQLAQQALADPLTGLPNKLSLAQDLGSGHPATALAILGLARFDEITQRLGYAGSDKALMALGSRLQSASRDGERVYKLPGHEFAVLLSHEQPQLLPRLQALLGALRGPWPLGGQSIVIEPRIGCLPLAPGENDVESGLRRAALALRRAHAQPDNDIVFYEPQLELALLRRQRLESELRAALAADQLTLYLQPKVAVAEGTLAGAEALIRWPHAEGMIPPGDFLSLAQDSGLMPEIDAFVLRRTIRMLSELRSLGLEVPVSINLSVDALCDDRLESDIARLLAASGLPPRLLEIELPENALIRDVGTSMDVLARLNAMGVRLSVDDFGTGYSSFSYLARFPVHALKIDRSFITGLVTSPTHQKIVKGIIRVAHSLQLSVVAEGAETAEELQALRRLHCDTVQGYAYARPMPMPEFVAFAQRQQAVPRMRATSI